MRTLNEVLEKANELYELEESQIYFPELEVGETVTINDLWDGNGEIENVLDSKSYSYNIATEDNDDAYVNYEFEVLEEKENPLETVIKVTSIDLI